MPGGPKWTKEYKGTKETSELLGQAPAKAPATGLQLSVNIITCGLGTGIFTLPWSTAGASVLPAIAIIAIVLALNSWTISILVEECPGICEEYELHSKVRGRFLLDDMVPEAVSKLLMEFAPHVVRPGDGFQGYERPFKQSELVGGIIPVDAAKWAMDQPEDNGKRDKAKAWVRAYIDVSRKLKSLTDEHFGLTGHTYFDYIQLVCRRHDESSEPSDDFSHPPHADNCARTKDGECVHDQRVRHWRTHTATLYFHGPDDGDFDGGTFFFTPRFDSDPEDYVLVPPKAGRMLAYESGETNIHGVEGLTRGVRCQTSIWLTQDEEKAYHDQELDRAEAVLSGVPIENNPDFTANPHDWRGAQKRYEKICSDSLDAEAVQGLEPVELPLLAEGRNLTVELVSTKPNPQVTRIRNFLTPEEIHHIINVSSPKFKKATVFEQGKLVEAPCTGLHNHIHKHSHMDNDGLSNSPLFPLELAPN